MLNIREALAAAKDNHRKRRAGRGDRRILGVKWSKIEDMAEDALAQKVAAGLGHDDAIEATAKEVGEWLDKVTKWNGAKELISDLVIDHVIEPLVRSLLREALYWAQKRSA